MAVQRGQQERPRQQDWLVLTRAEGTAAAVAAAAANAAGKETAEMKRARGSQGAMARLWTTRAKAEASLERGAGRAGLCGQHTKWEGKLRGTERRGARRPDDGCSGLGQQRSEARRRDFRRTSLVTGPQKKNGRSMCTAVMQKGR